MVLFCFLCSSNFLNCLLSFQQHADPDPQPWLPQSWYSHHVFLVRIFSGKYLPVPSYFSNSCRYLDLCRGKKHSPPSLSILAFIQADWLIDFFIKYFVPVSFYLRVHWCMSALSLSMSWFRDILLWMLNWSLFMYPVQMPSIMYLILVYAKKQRITFFDPPSRRVRQKNFTRIILDSANHWAPFSWAWVQNRFLPRRHTLYAGLWISIHFFRIRIQQFFWMRMRIQEVKWMRIRIQLDKFCKK